MASATELAYSVTQLDGSWKMALEWKLPSGSVVGSMTDWPISGRIDLILQSESDGSERFWVVDFKTGKDQPLSLDRLRKGDGIQLALYALALDSTAEEISVSLLRPGETLEVQLSSSQLKELDPLWSDMRKIAQSGRLGWAGAVWDHYRFVGDFPIATVPLPKEIWKPKWEREHPHLPIPGGRG